MCLLILRWILASIGCRGSKFQSFFAWFHFNGRPLIEFSGQDLNGQRVLQFALDRPFERTGTVIGIVANLGQVGARLRADIEMIAATGEQRGNVPELDLNDLRQVLAAKRMENDDLVDAVQELGPEVCLQDMR